MFLSLLEEKYCSICNKLERSRRSRIDKNNTFIEGFQNSDSDANDIICSCVKSKTHYVESSFLFRVIQIVVLIILFTAIVSMLFWVRNSSVCNLNLNRIISGYSEYHNSSKGIKEQNHLKAEGQFVRQIISHNTQTK